MSILDTAEKFFKSTDVDDKILEKFGIEGGITADQIKQIEKLVSAVDVSKIDIAAIAKKVGSSEDIVKKIVGQLIK